MHQVSLNWSLMFGSIDNPYPGLAVWWSAINLLWVKQEISKSFLSGDGQYLYHCSRAPQFESCFSSGWGYGLLMATWPFPVSSEDMCCQMGQLSETMNSHLPDLYNQHHTVRILEWADLPRDGTEELWKCCRLQTLRCYFSCSDYFSPERLLSSFFLLVVVVWSGKLSIKD